MNDRTGSEIVDELRGIREQLLRMNEALEWFNILQTDRRNLKQPWTYK